MSPFETAYFELYISDGLHNMKNMRTSNFFLGLTIFLLAACSSSIDEDLDIKKDVDDPVSEKTFSLLSVDETDFNLDGMNKFMKQFPVSSKITEFATTNRILITFDKNDWIVSNFDFVKSCVEDFFPSHLNILLQINK